MAESIITAITRIGVGEIARLETESHTYVANGFLMHNSVNEFRGQLADQAANLMPRAEAEARFIGMSEKIDELKTYQASAIGREGAAPTTSDQIARIEAKMDSLATFRDSTGGKSAGLNQGWVYLLGGVSLISTFIAIFLALR